ncbi:MAG: peptidylprolyl isomerase [Candidatus Aquicultorales bacterium]
MSFPEVKNFDALPDASELVAVIETDKGEIIFEFYPDKAPSTITNFVKLAREGYYDGTTFHRYEPGFVIQGGDPYSKTEEGQVGTGGPGYWIVAEFTDQPHLEGTVAMARSGYPDSAGSQFYICLAPAPFLDGQYTVFGQVVKGMDVVKQLRAGDVMNSVKIVSKEDVSR